MDPTTGGRGESGADNQAAPPPASDLWRALLTGVATSEQRITFDAGVGQRLVIVSEAALAQLQDKADRYDRMTRHVVLTPQEHEVLRRVASGCTAAQVAQDLTLAISTITQHLTAVRRKFRVNSTAEAIQEAAANGQLD